MKIFKMETWGGKKNSFSFLFVALILFCNFQISEDIQSKNGNVVWFVEEKHLYNIEKLHRPSRLSPRLAPPLNET